MGIPITDSTDGNCPRWRRPSIYLQKTGNKPRQDLTTENKIKLTENLSILDSEFQKMEPLSRLVSAS